MEDIECFYCGTLNRLGRSTKTSSLKLAFPVLSAEWTRSKVVPSEINCPVCRRKYQYLRKVDPEYLKQRVVFAENALKQLKRMSGYSEGLGAMLEGNRGIAIESKALQAIRFKELDIGVRIGGRRTYLHCRKTGRKDQIRLFVTSLGGGGG